MLTDEMVNVMILLGKNINDTNLVSFSLYFSYLCTRKFD